MDIAETKAKPSLVSKSLSALKWNYLGRLISLSLQFSIGVVLARILGPEPFGLVAIALFVQGLGNLFAEGGLSSALIQSQEISEQDIRSVFSTQMLIGILISFGVMGFAPLLAKFFNEPKATPVIMVMALSFLIQAAGQTANALLKKNLEFKKIQLISLSSYCIAYLGLGLPLAFHGFGVWSLVTAQLSQVSLNSILTFMQQKHAIFPLTGPHQCRFLRFGAAMTLNNITSWGISNLDTAIIGRCFETPVLGIYNRVLNLVYMPMHAITSSMQSVLFSAYANAQQNRQVLQRTFVASISIMALLFFPIYAAMAAIPELIIPAIYGDKWQAAIPLMTPLCLAMAANAMLAMSGPMLSAIGEPQIELKTQLLTLFFSIPGLIWAAQQSILTLTWVLLATFILRLLLLVTATLKAIGEKRFRLILVSIVPLLISSLLYVLCGFLANTPYLQAYPAPIRLGLVVIVCGIVYPLLLLLGRKLIFRGHLKAFTLSLQHKLPATLFKLTGLSV